MIVQEVGWEKMAYFTAIAWYIAPGQTEDGSQDDVQQIDLISAIHEKARQAHPAAAITDAMY